MKICNYMLKSYQTNFEKSTVLFSVQNGQKIAMVGSFGDPFGLLRVIGVSQHPIDVIFKRRKKVIKKFLRNGDFSWKY